MKISYTNTEIQEKANRLLTNDLGELLANNDKKLGEHPSKENHEVGIDYFFEIFDRNSNESLNIIYNQNKGTDDLKIIKSKSHKEYGKISFQLKIRHARYFFYELNKPILFTLCDIKTKKVYWYWIQLNNDIPKRVKEQQEKNKETLQIYIPQENVLNEENYVRFYNDLEKCDRIQTYKYLKPRISKTRDYDFSKLENSKIHIVDKIIESIKKFEGLTIVPTHILRKTYPFRGSIDKTYIHSDTLTTDNEDLFDLFSCLELNENELIIKEGIEYELSLQTYSKKIKEIIEFFKINLIYHLKWNGKSSKDRICLHNLFEHDNCNCERCNYNRLDFQEASNILKTENDDENLLEIFRKAYTHYLLGDFKSAYHLYKKIKIETEQIENSILNILCKYNLLNLKQLIKNNYFEGDRHLILKDLENISFALDELIIQDNLQRDIFEWIKGNQFINSASWEIDRLLIDFQNHHRKDKYGGYFIGSQASNLKFEFLRISFFIEFNLIIYDIFNEFQVLVHKSLEAMFALYDIYNPESTKYEAFEFTFLFNWLMHADSKKVNHLLLKYNIGELKLNDQKFVYERFHENLRNLKNSIHFINSKKGNYIFEDKVKNISQNFIFILSRIKLNKKNINSLYYRFLQFIISSNNKYLISSLSFEALFHYRNDISLKNTLSTLKILADNDLYATKSYSKTFDHFIFQNKTEGNKFDALKIFFQIENERGEINIEKDFYKNYKKYTPLLESNDITNVLIESVGKYAIKRLKNEFDSNYYYILTIYEIIPYHKELFNMYVASIVDMTKKPSGREVMFGRKQLKNFDLNGLINLIYKFDIPIGKKLTKLSSYAHDKDYYDWLLNLETFDYSKFQAYWILEYQTSIYFKEFKKHNKLKLAIKKSLNENYVEGIAKIYINNF